jgi:predicted transposase YdaD
LCGIWQRRRHPHVAIVRYILSADLDGEAVKNRVASLSSERLRTKAMSVAEQLRQEGRQKGRLEGRQEGRLEGRQEGLLVGSIQTLQRVLGKRVTPAKVLLKRSADQLKRQHAALQGELR